MINAISERIILFNKIKTNELLFSHIPVILKKARASYGQENEPTSIEADIKPSYFDLQICTEWHNQHFCLYS